ncbi:MAG: metallopeptidase family protein [Paeniglutamicibacter terrestris]|jgi:predicted Zn-dependent protease with MMP-like domain|uniref:Metallopeptidase family protein n=1 Tax=Paeniglutamicibacter terrestris TaxID=2723403 RepID=A0ABX1G5B0_9MICC|nr:metallopeptidase family protein [Paeniglutamicibacter terrestris]ASN40226.1 hypothetical protein CGQ24_15250 [Arthrobacter sp. 7749]NKG21441.1 metallopeptidase family protein [Paeniglutamicibacter terrestris]
MLGKLSIDLDTRDPRSLDSGVARSFETRKRNRHGRGRRGPMLMAPLPGARTRAERFEDLLVESAERLADRWGDRVTRIDFRILQAPAAKVITRAEAAGIRVPWATSRSARRGEPERITLYRRPIEEASHQGTDLLPELIHFSIVEQLAELWAMDPQAVDPGYGAWGPER